ncbi:MAG: response regulator, partial [Pseudomonadota bacterium]
FRIRCGLSAAASHESSYGGCRVKQMARSDILADKTVLAVDDEPDVLETLREILEDHKNLVLHTATDFDHGRQLLYSHNYDIVILDIMGVQGFDLLKIASNRGFPVVMLTAHAVNPEALKRSIELGAGAYLPKERLDSLPGFLEDILRRSYSSVWRRAFHDLLGLFDERFGSNWRKSEQQFWTEFEKNLQVEEPVIISRKEEEK